MDSRWSKTSWGEKDELAEIQARNGPAKLHSNTDNNHERQLSTPDIREMQKIKPTVRSYSLSNMLSISENYAATTPRTNSVSFSTFSRPIDIVVKSWKLEDIEDEDKQIGKFVNSGNSNGVVKHQRQLSLTGVRLPPLAVDMNKPPSKDMQIIGVPALDININDRRSSTPKLDPLSDNIRSRSSISITPRNIQSAGSVESGMLNDQQIKSNSVLSIMHFPLKNDVTSSLKYDNNNNEDSTINTYTFVSQPTNINSNNIKAIENVANVEETNQEPVDIGSEKTTENSAIVLSEGGNIVKTDDVKSSLHEKNIASDSVDTKAVSVYVENKIYKSPSILQSSYKYRVPDQDEAVQITVHNNKNITTPSKTCEKLANGKTIKKGRSDKARYKPVTGTKPVKRVTKPSKYGSIHSDKLSGAKKAQTKKINSETSSISGHKVKSTPPKKDLMSRLNDLTEKVNHEPQAGTKKFYATFEEEQKRSNEHVENIKKNHAVDKIANTEQPKAKNNSYLPLSKFKYTNQLAIQDKPSTNTEAEKTTLSSASSAGMSVDRKNSTFVITPVIVDAYPKPVPDKHERELLAKITEAPIRVPLPRRIHSAITKTRNNFKSGNSMKGKACIERSKSADGVKNNRKKRKNKDKDGLDFDPESQVILGGKGWAVVVDKNKEDIQILPENTQRLVEHSNTTKTDLLLSENIGRQSLFSLSPIPELLSPLVDSIRSDSSFQVPVPDNEPIIRSKNDNNSNNNTIIRFSKTSGNEAQSKPEPIQFDTDAVNTEMQNVTEEIKTKDNVEIPKILYPDKSDIPKLEQINDRIKVDESVQNPPKDLIKKFEIINQEEEISIMEESKPIAQQTDMLMITGTQLADLPQSDNVPDKHALDTAPQNEIIDLSLPVEVNMEPEKKIRKKVKIEHDHDIYYKHTVPKKKTRKKLTPKEIAELARSHVEKDYNRKMEQIYTPRSELENHIMKVYLDPIEEDEELSILDAILAEGVLMNMFYPDEVSQNLFPGQPLSNRENSNESSDEEEEDIEDDVSVISLNTTPIEPRSRLDANDSDSDVSTLQGNESPTASQTYERLESNVFDAEDLVPASDYDTEAEVIEQLLQTQTRNKDPYDSEDIQFTDTEYESTHNIEEHSLHRRLTIDNLKSYNKQLQEEHAKNKLLNDVYLQSRTFRPVSQMTTQTETSVSSVDTILDTNACKDFKMGKLLGNGAFGKVYEGFTAGGSMIAVKVIGLVGNRHNMSVEEQYTKIQHEVDILKSLRHENIVGYIGSRLDGMEVLLFLEKLDGGTVESNLKQYGKFNEKTIRKYTKQILEGVKYLHEKNVIHRDIKGQNIMVAPPSTLKLIDFGSATIFADQHDEENITPGRENKLHGTPFWMAPENYEHKDPTSKSDVWSIGCTVYEMATLKPPWYNVDNVYPAIYGLLQKRPMPELDKDEFSTRCREFVNSCFNYEPRERPSVQQLLNHPFILGKRRSRTSTTSQM